MYMEAPSSALSIAGPFWRTRLMRTKKFFKIENTEDREYGYFMGAMSQGVMMAKAYGAPVEVTRIVVEPPNEERNDDKTAFDRMPPIAFYPDSLQKPGPQPIFCLPMAKFKHRPAKRDMMEKIIFVALVLQAVGHLATTEGTDPDLWSKDPKELVFRRLGLAYTADGGWTSEHDEIIKKIPLRIVRII
jgi:hypothetical protein